MIDDEVTGGQASRRQHAIGSTKARKGDQALFLQSRGRGEGSRCLQLSQCLVQSWKDTTHLVQHFYHGKDCFFSVAPRCGAANPTALYFGCACEYAFRVRAREAVHVKLCEQWQGGNESLAVDTSLEDRANGKPYRSEQFIPKAQGQKQKQWISVDPVILHADENPLPAGLGRGWTGSTMVSEYCLFPCD